MTALGDKHRLCYGVIACSAYWWIRCKVWGKRVRDNFTVCDGATGRLVCPLLWWGRPSQGDIKTTSTWPWPSCSYYTQRLSQDDAHRRCTQLSRSEGFSTAITLPLFSQQSFTLSLKPFLSALPHCFVMAAGSTELEEIRHIDFILRHSWENTREIKVVLT